MSSKKKMEQEKLLQTQVLNIDEVRKVAKYEKKISKKPAAVIAFLGSVLLLMGAGTQGYIAYNNFNEQQRQEEKEIAQRREMRRKQEKIVKTTMTCTKNNTDEENGTNSQIKYIFSFENDKMKFETKEFSLQAIDGNPNGGNTTYGLFTAYLSYQSINNTIDGYTVKTEQVGQSGFQVTTNIDFSQIEMESLPQTYKSNPNLTPDFSLDTASAPVKSAAESCGFTCVIE